MLSNEYIRHIDPSLAFLDTYSNNLDFDQILPDQTTTTDGKTSRAKDTSPRILGKLKFMVANPNNSELLIPPRTFRELYTLVEQGILNCTNGDRVDSFVNEWTRSYTNAAAENALRNSSFRSTGREGTHIIFPITGHNRPASVPEMLCIDADGCLSPSEPTSIRWFNKHIARKGLIKPENNVLDMCCGSGITAILAGYMNEGQGQVVACDIMPKAVQTAQANARLHGLDNVSVVQSDMFDNLDPALKFDVIAINPPFTEKALSPEDIAQNGTPLLEAVHDFGFRVLKRFFAGASDHLAENGNIYMLYEDIKAFPNGQNAVQYVLNEYNQTADNKFGIKTMGIIRRARVDDQGNKVLVPMVIYNIFILP